MSITKIKNRFNLFLSLLLGLLNFACANQLPTAEVPSEVANLVASVLKAHEAVLVKDNESSESI